MSRKNGRPAQEPVRLAVQVQPNAKRSGIVGMHGDAVKIRLQAQPVEGKANEALISFVAATLGLPKSAVSVSHGLTSRRKLLEIAAPHMTPDELRQALLAVRRRGLSGEAAVRSGSRKSVRSVPRFHCGRAHGSARPGAQS